MINLKEIEELEALLKKMKPGPYEYWEQPDNDLLAAECTAENGTLIAALPGIASMSNEFRAIAALLNAAPALIESVKYTFRNNSR